MPPDKSESGEATGKELLTQSSLGAFRNCRAKFRWRYIEHLRTPITNINYFFGSIIHEVLEVWHATRSFDNALTVINASFNWKTDPDQNDARLIAIAMMERYCEIYAEEEFKIIELEHPFELDIKNPETNGISKTYRISGKADGLVQDEQSRYWLLENKTASQIDGKYLDRLWGDFQIAFYSYALERKFDIQIYGIIYNVLSKTRIKRKLGETDDEFSRRKDETVGTSSAKQKDDESNAEYEERLAIACAKNRQTKLDKLTQKETDTDEKYLNKLTAWYHERPLSIMRETIILSRDRIAEIEEEVWELSKALLHARNREHYYKNNAFCFHYMRQCEYFDLCAAGERWSNVAGNLFEIVEPHGEVDEENKWLKRNPGGDYEFIADNENKTETPTF